eukprot:448154_1
MGNNVSPDSRQWACSSCTYLNEWKSTKCTICNTDVPQNKQWRCQTCKQLCNSDETECFVCVILDEPIQIETKYTPLAELAHKNDEMIEIKLNISNPSDDRFNHEFLIFALYSKQETLGNVFDKVEKHLNDKYKPIKLKYDIVDGFAGYNDIESIRNRAITYYDKTEFIDGLNVSVKVEYVHKVHNISINCEYMKKNNTNNPLHCAIYYAMKEQYEYSQDNLNHILSYNHFANEYLEKPQCKYGQDCKAYIRSENGQNRLNDTCHMKIYRHPPRTRNIKLSENINSLVINKNEEQNQ